MAQVSYAMPDAVYPTDPFIPSRRKLLQIRKELIKMAGSEAICLWRMAREAQNHGCSDRLVEQIREEADWCYTTATAYPERLLCPEIMDRKKFAFKSGKRAC